ncbi:SPOR domain-containing protein [Thiomicrorhabdus indica]|uniref:SPOR domain-containing protein n=1 Tax=Thiomicrorhabdus indica TaxID=2267253 RepID=UPI00102DF1D2|nr:SPOR domain-containing protein [Thiomicrorhabdus indica]
MPTISEIEAERAKILAEIEDRAKQNAANPEGASLKDWLNAAQEVVPPGALGQANNLENNTQSNISNYQATAEQSTADIYSDDDVKTSFSQAMQQSMQTPSATAEASSSQTTTSLNANKNTTMQNPKSNAAGFSIAALLLQISILTIFSLILYFGHRDLTKQISDIRSTSSEELAEIKQAIEQGGINEEAQKQMSAMDERIQFLESQLSLLQEQISEMSSQSTQQLDLSNLSELSQEQKQTIGKTLSLNTGLSEELLDKKLSQYNEKLAKQLDARLDQKLRPILAKLNLQPQKTPVTVAEPEENNITIKAPESPELPEVKTPIMETPLLTMVAPKVDEKKNVGSVKSIQPVKPIESPKKAAESKKIATNNSLPKFVDIKSEDLQWVKSQKASSFTLQLASMKTAKDLQRLVANKGLKDTKILPQVRNGNVNYILLYETIDNREIAKKLADDIKKQTGISPWIRKLQDIQGKTGQ